MLEATISRDLLALAAQVVPTLGLRAARRLRAARPVDRVHRGAPTSPTRSTCATHLEAKRASMEAHVSQTTRAAPPSGRSPCSSALPDELFATAFGTEWYVDRRCRRAAPRPTCSPRWNEPDDDDTCPTRRTRTAEGLAALRVPAHLVEHELAGKSPRRRVIEIVVSLAVVVVLFAFAIPSIIGSGYAEIFEHHEAADDRRAHRADVVLGPRDVRLQLRADDVAAGADPPPGAGRSTSPAVPSPTSCRSAAPPASRRPTR